MRRLRAGSQPRAREAGVSVALPTLRSVRIAAERPHPVPQGIRRGSHATDPRLRPRARPLGGKRLAQRSATGSGQNPPRAERREAPGKKLQIERPASRAPSTCSSRRLSPAPTTAALRRGADPPQPAWSGTDDARLDEMVGREAGRPPPHRRPGLAGLRAVPCAARERAGLCLLPSAVRWRRAPSRLRRGSVPPGGPLRRRRPTPLAALLPARPRARPVHRAGMAAALGGHRGRAGRADRAGWSGDAAPAHSRALQRARTAARRRGRHRPPPRRKARPRRPAPSLGGARLRAVGGGREAAQPRANASRSAFSRSA